MAEKAQDNAAVIAQSDEEEEDEIQEPDIPSDRESEEGQGEGGPSSTSTPKKKKPVVGKSPAKKKKITSAGMQIPEYWPWEEAKKLFITPDVVKGDDLEVG
jgi:flap endonuclease-1